MQITEKLSILLIICWLISLIIVAQQESFSRSEEVRLVKVAVAAPEINAEPHNQDNILEMKNEFPRLGVSVEEVNERYTEEVLLSNQINQPELEQLLEKTQKANFILRQNLENLEMTLQQQKEINHNLLSAKSESDARISSLETELENLKTHNISACLTKENSKLIEDLEFEKQRLEEELSQLKQARDKNREISESDVAILRDQVQSLKELLVNSEQGINSLSQQDSQALKQEQVTNNLNEEITNNIDNDLRQHSIYRLSELQNIQQEINASSEVTVEQLERLEKARLAFEEAQQNVSESIGALGVHIVTKGDTLSEIAVNYYNDLTRWPEILNVNNFLVGDPDNIFPGFVLILPN